MQEIIPPGESLSREQRLRRLEWLAQLMDSQFEIPGTGFRIGLDPILGLLPFIGDTLSALVSLYILQEARTLGVPRHVQARMSLNIFIDWAIGSIPLLGDAFDAGWKSNQKNVELLRRHLWKMA
jgi:hypothetical protein